MAKPAHTAPKIATGEAFWIIWPISARNPPVLVLFDHGVLRKAVSRRAAFESALLGNKLFGSMATSYYFLSRYGYLLNKI
jgi:hypothetical protein